MNILTFIWFSLCRLHMIKNNSIWIVTTNGERCPFWVEEFYPCKHRIWHCFWKPMMDDVSFCWQLPYLKIKWFKKLYSVFTFIYVINNSLNINQLQSMNKTGTLTIPSSAVVTNLPVWLARSIPVIHPACASTSATMSPSGTENIRIKPDPYPATMMPKWGQMGLQMI